MDQVQKDAVDEVVVVHVDSTPQAVVAVAPYVDDAEVEEAVHNTRIEGEEHISFQDNHILEAA